MIIGIGIDSTDINRFAHWKNYSDEKLRRIFSPEEIEYGKSHSDKTAERFAVRFAAREALYKALSTAVPDHTIPFLTLCAAIKITKNADGAPKIWVDHSRIRINLLHDCTIWLSLSHAKNVATALVILEKK